MNSTPAHRKDLDLDRLLKLRLFSELSGVIQRQGKEGVDSGFVMETLALSLPDENLEQEIQQDLKTMGWPDEPKYRQAALRGIRAAQLAESMLPELWGNSEN